MAIQPTVSIKAAEDEERAIATITMAFIADPIVRWFIHDSARYLRYWPSFVRAFGGGAFEHGSADVAGDYAGVALWVPPGVEAQRHIGGIDSWRMPGGSGSKNSGDYACRATTVLRPSDFPSA